MSALEAPMSESTSPSDPKNESSEPLKDIENEFKLTRGFLLAFFSICIITLAVALDATSLSIALPIITQKLNGTAIEAFWSGTSFLVASAVSQPVIAGLSHVFGRKQLVLGSSVLFAVGSLVAALAKNFTMMLVGRTIQGIGGGGILTLGEILVTDLVPLRLRGTWFGYLGAMWALGSVTGPLMGGALSQNVSWRWIFWINLPIIVLGGVAIAFFLTIDKLPGQLFSKVRRFDWSGSALFTASTVSFMVPLTWGGVMYSWSSWHTLVPLLLGAAGLVGFAYYEYRLFTRAFDPEGKLLGHDLVEPIIRMSIFNNTTMLITYFETLIHGIVLWSLLYFLPLYYEAVQGYTPIISGVAILPESTFVAPIAVLVGIVCAKTGHWRWAIWIGWTMTTLGAGLLVLLNPHTSIAGWLFLNIPVSIGTGMLFPAMGLGVQAAGRAQDAGHATAFYSFFRVFGQSLGVAISGVVFQNQIKQKLMKYPLLAPLAGEYSKDATLLVEIIKAMEEGTMKTQLVEAYADSLKMVWIVMCALSAVALVVSAFTKEYSLTQEHKTQQGYRETKVVDQEVTMESGRKSSSLSGLEKQGARCWKISS